MQQKNGSSESSLTTSLFGDWAKLMSQFSSPHLSMKQLIVSHQRNCEAVNKVAALATESMSSVFHRQLDAAGSLTKDGLSVLNKVIESGTPREKVVLQTEWAKDRLEKGISSLRDLSDIVTAANIEAGNVLAKRLNESIGELNSSVAS